MNMIRLFHGTDHIIEVPDIKTGNPRNDYGKGFYCTRAEEMAQEYLPADPPYENYFNVFRVS